MVGERGGGVEQEGMRGGGEVGDMDKRTMWVRDDGGREMVVGGLVV